MTDEPTVIIENVPTDKRLTGIPDSSIFTEGATLPVGSIWIKLRSPVEGEAALTVAYDPLTGTFTQPTLYNPKTGKSEAQRSMTIIKASALIASIGSTAIWTPAAGRAVRILGFSVVVSTLTTTAAGSLVTIKEGATTIDNLIHLAVAAPAVPIRWAAPLPQNGYLAAKDAVINVDLSAAATAGGVYVNIWGCEE